MSPTVISINAIAVACLIASVAKDRARTAQALRMALRSGARLAPTLLGVLIVIGLLLGFVTPSSIARVVGEGSGFSGVIYTGLLGSVLHIPSLVSFPLAGSLLRSGASATVVAVFITTLTMVGLVTLPLEMRLLGNRFALVRNGLSLFCAFVIGLLVGVVV